MLITGESQEVDLGSPAVSADVYALQVKRILSMVEARGQRKK